MQACSEQDRDKPGGKKRSREVADHQGITWMELLILYEVNGGAQPPPQHARYLQLAARGKKGDRKEAKELRRIRKDMLRKAPTLRQSMKKFKAMVKQITLSCLGDEDQKYFAAATSPITRLKQVAILNMMPAIKVTREL